jgi:hypothetical protein
MNFKKLNTEYEFYIKYKVLNSGNRNLTQAVLILSFATKTSTSHVNSTLVLSDSLHRNDILCLSLADGMKSNS